MPEDKARRFGNYVLKRPLGHGALGTVYLAEDVASHRRVALKVLSATFAGNGEYTRSFLTEARLATQLHHPSIVSVYDYGRERGHYYLAMEYVEGENLETRLERDGPLPEADVLRVARAVFPSEQIVRGG
jgi:serine/threonine-protein kinase